MLKNLAIALLMTLSIAFVQAQSSPKFGHINTQELFEIMPEKKAGEKKIEEVSKKYENELLKMQEELKKKYNDFMAEADTLPEAIKTRRMQSVQELDQRIQNFQQTAMQSIQKEQQALIAPITEKINKAIKAVASEQGFDYVFDTSTPGLLYRSDKTVNIIADVKKKLGL